MYSSPLIRGLHAWALLGSIVLCGLWTMDVLTDPERAAGTAGEGPAAAPTDAHPGEGRLFVLVIDSLRYETAVDPSIMPHLVSMQRSSVFARMLSIRDPVTVPALRAAFTGRDRFALFGFVRNLHHREEGFSSLFTQLQEAGRAAAIFSDGSFRQFGSGPLIEQFDYDPGTEETEATIQTASMEEALAAFLSGPYRLVVGHVNYSDHGAHRFGVHREEYGQIFGQADDLVRRLDEALPPGASLLVMGDHGHDEGGHHLIGMDVPTFVLCRGPGFVAGADLGTIHIADTRYLASWALELPLPPSYPSGRHPHALVAEGELPAEYAAAYDLVADHDRRGAGVLAGRRGEFFLVMAGLGVVAALWVGLVRRPERGAWRALAAWTSVALLGMSALGPVAPASGLLVGAVALGWSLRAGAATHADALRWLLPAAGAVPLVLWGWLLSEARPLVHYPRFSIFVPALTAAVAAGAVAAARWGAMRLAWVFFALGGVLAYPTVYRYGAPALMATVWGSWLVFMAVETFRPARNEIPAGRRAAPRAGLLVAACLFLAPFALVQAHAAQFVRWYGPLADLVWRGPHWSGLPAVGLAAALLAKAIVFVPWRGGRAATLLGLAVAALVQGLQVRAAGGADFAGPDRFVYPGAALLLAGAAAVVPSGLEVRRTLLLGSLYAAHLYLVRVPAQAYLWLDLLLAALCLSARHVRFDAALRPRPGAYLLLLASAVWACGWCALAWTFHWLEWDFLYDWLDAGFVEVNAGAFIVPIVVRYLVPLVMARVVLARELEGRLAYPQRAAALLAGLKTLSVLLIACGMGYSEADNDFYLEAVQEASIWAVLAAALVIPGRAGRRGAGTGDAENHP